MQSFNRTKLIKEMLKTEHLIKYKWQGKRIRESDEVTLTIEELTSELNNDTFKFSSLKKTNAHGKVQYSLSDLRDFLVAKLVNHELIKAYEIKLVDRDNISKQIAVFLQEKVDFTVYKFDVKDFYESINVQEIISKIKTDQLIPMQSIRLITDLFIDKESIPRGLPLSSTLSEIFMQDIDDKISNLLGVYHYIRYVDDMILFVHDKECMRADYIKENVKSILEGKKLYLNDEKYNKIEIRKKDNSAKIDSPPKILEYLGYKFTRTKDQLNIKIADKKISRFKRRIYYTIKDYCKTNDKQLLIDRLRFLSGNYKINVGFGKVLAGIRCNYKLLTFNTHKDQLDHYHNQLSELDKYLHSILRSKELKIGESVDYNLHKDRLFNNPQIARISFLHGYDKTIVSNFDLTRISEIRKVWIYDKK